ncbi:MAG: hypothetical protein ACFCVH_20525 [Alphaproteobacteria bacterium]
MVVVTLGLMILFVVLLTNAIVWIVPVMAGAGSGWLAIAHGSGWLLAIGAGVFGAALAICLFSRAMACRSASVRVLALAVYAVPPMLAGGATARAFAIETGAEGPVWPILAAVIGGAVFGATAVRSLAAMAPVVAPAPSVRPAPDRTARRQPMPPEPEPKVIYYRPVRPPTPRLADGRGRDPVVDL